MLQTQLPQERPEHPFLKVRCKGADCGTSVPSQLAVSPASPRVPLGAFVSSVWAQPRAGHPQSPTPSSTGRDALLLPCSPRS